MKNIFLIVVLLVTATSFSQEMMVVVGHKRPPMAFSANYSGPVGHYVGLGLEIGDFTESGMTSILNANYAMMNGKGKGGGSDGQGFGIDVGGRQYIIMTQNYARFYLENLFSYSRVEFSDPGYSGVYEYVSFLNPSIGYKFKFGEFSIDPSAGLSWRIEIMSRGDVNNKDYSNFVGKYGIKLGYSF